MIWVRYCKEWWLRSPGNNQNNAANVNNDGSRNNNNVNNDNKCVRPAFPDCQKPSLRRAARARGGKEYRPLSQVSAEKQTDGGPDASICFRDFEAVEQLYMQYKQSDCSVMCIWKQSALGLQRCAFHGFPSGINVIVFVKIFIKIKNGHGILWSCCSVGKSGVLLDE